MPLLASEEIGEDFKGVNPISQEKNNFPTHKRTHNDWERKGSPDIVQ